MELKKGSNGPEVIKFYDFMQKYAKSYAFLLGSRDGYFGGDEERFVIELQRRLQKAGISGIVIDGKFGDRTASACGYKWIGTSAPPVVEKRRKIWLLSNPGSGANEFQGPSFQLGERAKNVLKINHQPVHSELGGYLGFMGGDPKFSYIEVNWTVCKSIEFLLRNNPDINDPEFELWLSGYSQKADGVEDAVEYLFGDGGFVHPGDPDKVVMGPGEFRHLRDRINGIINFGNPSTKGTGIARKVRPAWLYKILTNINYPNDFYAVATDSIRPPMYAIIIQAEMELPFFVHVMKIAMKVMEGMLPIFGGLLGPLGPMAVAGLAGVNNLAPMLGGIMGQAASADEEVDRQLAEMFSVTGLIKNVPGIIALVGALPGLQAHGGYEFDPVMMDKAFRVMEVYTR